MNFADNVKETTTGTSAAVITLAGAVTKFRTFADAFAVGTTDISVRMQDDAGNWESSWYTLTNATTLTRTAIAASSNDGAATVFHDGAKEVFCTLHEGVMARLARDDATALSDLGDAATVSLFVKTAAGVRLIPLTAAGIAGLQLPTVTTLASGDYIPVVKADGTDARISFANLQAQLGGTGTTDTTPPTLSSPTGTSTGTTTASGTVSTNEANGTLYYLFATTSTATAAAVKAGATKTVTATGTQSVTTTGLTAATTYYAHYLHRDAAGNDSTVSSSAAFTTAAAGDSTAPILSSPTGAQTGSSTASGSVSTNEANGLLYRYASTNSTETAATIKAANLTTTVSATGVQNVTFSGLSAQTTYYAHFVHRDAAGNDSAVASSTSFTTTAAAATGVTMTGPTGGEVSVASTNFTVGVTPVGGTITGTVVVTPSDNGGGGTFSPASVSLTSGSPTGTFTYTPSSTAGARTISVTNNGGLTNPSNITYTSTAAQTSYTYTPYNSNATKDSILPSTGTLSGTSRYYNGTDGFVNLYVDISPVPASIVGGWSDSATVPPGIAASNENTTSGKLNRAVALTISSGRININAANLWAPDGVQSGPYWFWFKPVDGAWYRFSGVNGSTVLATG